MLLQHQPYLGLYSPHFLNIMNDTQQKLCRILWRKYHIQTTATDVTPIRQSQYPYQVQATFLSAITGAPIKHSPNLDPAQHAQPSLLLVPPKRRSALQNLEFPSPVHFLGHCLFAFPSRFLCG
ncbi:hypothetical protein HMPREF0663_12384 [Hoylesella oralis ATCC 33269]|uniref:Uncharacterized protein n=2 Tax=Hoylesella oralis TaxID=28134 RepID=E7RSW6_9BACT|nr:hypothetical protein HMPREF0663_12384 [Hoylesella oralis ATCC 33269]